MAPDQLPAAQFVRAFVANSPFARRTGLEVVDLSADRAQLRLPFDEGNVTVADVVHGGAIATLLDVAVTAAAFCAPEALDASSGATISLTVNYVRAGRGDLVAVGRRAPRRRSVLLLGRGHRCRRPHGRRGDRDLPLRLTPPNRGAARAGRGRLR